MTPDRLRLHLRLRICLLVVIASGCGGHHASPITSTRVPTPSENVLALLPDGAQVIVELDLARLRANATVGEAAKQALGGLGADSHVPGLPVSSPK